MAFNPVVRSVRYAARTAIWLWGIGWVVGLAGIIGFFLMAAIFGALH